MENTAPNRNMFVPIVTPSSSSGAGSDTGNNQLTEKTVKLKGDIESQIQFTHDDDDDAACSCCLAMCTCTTILALLAGCIAYITFGIMYLVQDYNLAKECSGSSLWAYALVAIILSLQRGNASNAKNDEGIVLGVLICMGLIEAGLGIWGGIELFVKSCDDLKESNLWKFCLATFVLQIFFAFLTLFVGPCIAFLLACKEKIDRI